MSFFIERARQLLHKDTVKVITPTLEHEGDPGWQGTESYKYKEWVSPDGRNSIFVLICGGPEYVGTYIKDISLSATGELSGGELMRVQAVTKQNSQEIEYNVYLDAITEKDTSWCITHINYFFHDNGAMHTPHSWAYPMKTSTYKNLSDQQFRKLCIAEKRAAGIHHMSEIPPEIDIEKTVATFMDQIRRLDFSKPKLIPKQSLILNSTPTPGAAEGT